LRYAIFHNNSLWDARDFTDDMIACATLQNKFRVDTWEGDLSPFRDRGGKLLHYHGLQDALISSENSARYYEHVSSTMHLDSPQLDSFYRYFKISGMDHCEGGSGAWQFGQTPRAASKVEPQDNVIMVMVDWVEKGVAPDTLRGTKHVGDDNQKGVEFTRRHCRYPRQNVYSRNGSHTQETSWACVEKGGVMQDAMHVQGELHDGAILV
jgi:feruloyl esterase